MRCAQLSCRYADAYLQSVAVLRADEEQVARSALKEYD